MRDEHECLVASILALARTIPTDQQSLRYLEQLLRTAIATAEACDA